MSRPPNAYLLGCSERGVPDVDRLQRVDDQEDYVKVCRGSHYEHFRRTYEMIRRHGRELNVFTWSHVTYVAE